MVMTIAMIGAVNMVTSTSAGNIVSPLFWNQSGEWWDRALIISLIITFVSAGAVALTTIGSIFAHKHETNAAEANLKKYQSEADGKIADASKAASDAAIAAYSAGETAGHAQAAVENAQVEIAKAQAEAARARLEQEKMKENNLALEQA